VIVGDVLIACSFVSYTGPFNKKFRQIMIQENFLKYFAENSIPKSQIANPVDILTTPATAALWNKQLLPND